MFLRLFTISLCFYVSLIIFSVVSLADERVSKENECISETVPAGTQVTHLVNTELTGEDLCELEKCMRLNVDNSVFPKLFSKYIKACKLHKEEQRAIDYFRSLAGETNRLSPHVLTAKAVVTYGWRAEKILREGLKEIDKAIMLDSEAFFPRLCRAAYLAYLPEGFSLAIDELYILLEKEKHNNSNLHDIYKNLSSIYRQHGHHAMDRNIGKKIQALRNRSKKNYDSVPTAETLQVTKKQDDEIVHFPYPFINSTNSANKISSAKDEQLDSHLTILEKYMERKTDDTIFGNLYTRYVLLAWQYQEINRAINFFEELARRHPQSSNVVAASGTITYGWRGQMLLQEGLHCLEKATGLNNEELFLKIQYATFISRFPNGFQKSMEEFSLLKEREKDSPKSLDTINYHISCIRLHHGYDRNKIVEFDKSEARQWS